MRIISGKFRGKFIRAPKQLPVRPTTDMAKESLFNILNNRIFFEDVTVLDLFSGIGSISLEFISRGTTKVTAVDQHPGCAAFLREIADEMQADEMTVVRAEALAYLSAAYTSYDIIFADPPYTYEDYDQILHLVFERSLLKEDGVLILEHERRKDFSDHPRWTESRGYGGVGFSFFR